MEKISELITWQIVVFLAEKKKKKKLPRLILSDTDRFGTSSFSAGDMSDFSLSKHQSYLGWHYSSSHFLLSLGKVEGKICIFIAHAFKDLKVHDLS